MYLSINLKQDKTIEKNEIHTIKIYSLGTWDKIGNKIYCFFDSSKNGFPRDTITLKISGKKLFFLKGLTVNKYFHLKKVDKPK